VNGIERDRPVNSERFIGSLDSESRPGIDLGLLDGPAAVDLPYEAVRSVECDQRLCLLLVRREPLGYGGGLVVVPLDEVASATVAHPVRLGRVVVDVEHCAAGGTDPAAREPLDDDVLGNDDVDDDVDVRHAGQRFGLVEGPGKSVEYEPGLAVVPVETFPHHVDDEVVGDEPAGVHERLRLDPEVGPSGDVLPQEIAR